MKKRCYFIYQYLKTIYNRQKYYIGFTREKETNPILSFDLREEKEFTKENKIPICKIIKEEVINNALNGDEKIINLNENNSNQLTQQIENNKNFRDVKEQRNNNKADMERDKIDQKDQKDYIQKENEEETNNKTLNKQNVSDYNIEINTLSKTFDSLYMNVTIIKLKDTIFGEELKYDKEELNILGELREDVKVNEEKMNKLIENVNKLGEKLKAYEKKMDILGEEVKSNEKKWIN